MKTFLASCILIFASPVWANQLACQVALLGGFPSKLAIGVLAETTNGERYIGISPYAGSVHPVIARTMAESLALKEIFWLGEIRYRIVHGRPLVFEANETSKFYFLNKNSPSVDVNGQSVTMANDARRMPRNIRAPNFRATAFDEQNKRLARELEHIDGDIRHTIGNSLQILSSLVNSMRGEKYTFERKTWIIEEYTVKNVGDFVLVRWLIMNLLEDDRINGEDALLVISVLGMLDEGPSAITKIAQIDHDRFSVIIQYLSTMVDPNLSNAPVDLYQVR